MALRAGIIGGGMIAGVHAAAVRASGNAVIGIASRSPDGARDASRALGTESFDTPYALIDSDLVDVIHVCTPNASHAAYVERAIGSGKRVVCEKPLGIDLAEAGRLRDLASKSGTATAVPFVYRSYATAREMRDRVQSGPKPLLLRGLYLQDWLVDAQETNWRVDDTLGGCSRAFADIGVHLCDLLEFVTGDRISRLVATMSTAYSDRRGRRVNTEDIASVLLETSAGVPGVVTVSQVAHGHKNHLMVSIDTAEASYGFDQEDPEKLFIGHSAGNTVQFRASAGFRGAEAARLSLIPAGHPQGYQDAFNAFIRDAYAVFAGSTSVSVPTFDDGYRAAQLTDAVIQSAQTQRWVTIDASEGAVQPRSWDLRGAS